MGGDHPGPLVMGPPVPRGGYRLELRGRPLSSTTEETGWGQPRHQGSGPGTEGRDHHTAQSRQLAGGRLWAVRHVPGTDGGMCSLSLCALCVCVRGCVLSQRFDCESRERYLERTTRALATQCTQCTQCNGRNVKRPPRLHRRVVSLEGRRATAWRGARGVAKGGQPSAQLAGLFQTRRAACPRTSPSHTHRGSGAPRLRRGLSPGQ